MKTTIILFMLLLMLVGSDALASAIGAESAQAEAKYAEGQLIVKLKEGYVLADLRELNDKYRVSTTEKVFKEIPAPQDTLREMEKNLASLNAEHLKWYWQLEKNSREYKDYLAKIEKEKTELTRRIEAKKGLIRHLEQRQKRAAKDAQAPDMDNVYILRTDEDADILGMATEYRASPVIEYAHPNYALKLQLVPNDEFYASRGSWGQGYDDLWGVKKIGCPQAWDISQGDGVIVAVVDSGVDYNHPDITENVWINAGEDLDHNGRIEATDFNGIDEDGNGFIDDIRGWNFHDTISSPEDNDPMDGYGHGTHVAGTIAAVGNNSLGIIGVAPRAKIMALKIANAWGGINIADVAQGIDYAVANGADVINLSLGAPQLQDVILYNNALRDATQRALTNGCVVVAAAGNSNEDMANFVPANIPGVITVASIDHNDIKSDFSSWGAGVVLSAPGGDSGIKGADGGFADFSAVNILSLRGANTDMLRGALGYSLGDAFYPVPGDEQSLYIRSVGTSMAAPHVSGAAALVLSQRPDFSNEQVQGQLYNTVDEIDSRNPDYKGLLGSGRLNVYSALTTTPRSNIKVSSIEVVDSGFGNSNGKVDPGEKVSLRIKLRNTWLDAQGVRATISSSSPFVTIEQANAEYGNLLYHQEDSAIVGVFTASPSLPRGETIPFTLHISANNGAYTAAEDFSAEVPALPLIPVALNVISPAENAVVSADGFDVVCDAWALLGVYDARISIFDYTRAKFTTLNNYLTYNSLLGRWVYHVDAGSITPGGAADLIIWASDILGLHSDMYKRRVTIQALPATPSITGFSSTKTHGSYGSRSISGGTLPIECRLGGPTQVSVYFSKPVKVQDGYILNNEVQLSSGSLTGVSISGSTLNIYLSSVANASTLTITLGHITDLSGNPLSGSNQVKLGVLAGDVNGDGVVNLLDLAQLRVKLDAALDNSNFRCDPNCDGLINIFDLSMCRLEFDKALPTIPLAPSNLIITNASSTQINLNWTDNSTNETGFKIERSTISSTSGFSQITTVAAGGTSYNNTGLNSGTTYYYRVRAYNTAGDSGYSNVVSATTTQAIPAAPTNFRVTATTSSSITVAWDASSGATSYYIANSQSSPAPWAQETTSTTITRSGLSPNTSYPFYLYAKNNSGTSATYAYVTGTTNPPAPDITPPTGSVVINNHATYTNANSVTLTLSATDNAGGSGMGAGAKMRIATENLIYTETLYRTTTTWNLSAGEGTKTIYVNFMDVAGNWSNAYSDTIILDKTPPTGSISIEGGAASTTKSVVTLTLSGADARSGVDKMQFSNDNATWSPAENYATTKSWPLSAGAGTKIVYVKFKDGAGNWSGSYSDTIVRQ